jgi:manganese/zinc/iron transport system substrate-binding protein
MNPLLKIVLLVSAMMLSGTLAGCDAGAPSSPSAVTQDPNAKLRIVCTTTMITDLIRQMVKDHAIVQGIMREGEDPHVYDVRPRDAQMIAAADVVFTNGLHLEATLIHVIEHNARSAIVNPLAESPDIQLRKSTTISGAPDPHCWMNVKYFMVYLDSALATLVKADPQHADAYRANAQAYRKQLESLDTWVQQQLNTVPRKQRVMVTSHDAFAYMGARYGIDVLAVIGMSTEQQPRPQDVIALEKSVRDRGVRAVFIETSVTQTLNDIVKKIADRTGVRIGGSLYSDSLGKAGTETGTYIGMIRHNVTILVQALR